MQLSRSVAKTDGTGCLAVPVLSVDHKFAGEVVPFFTTWEIDLGFAAKLKNQSPLPLAVSCVFG